MSVTSHENEEHDLLADYFEKSAAAVRDTFGRFEQDVARPLIEYALKAFRKHPILSTFVVFYLALSALPVLSFIGFALFIFTTSVFIGLATAIFGAACAVGFFGFWLACTLIFFFFLSLNLTISTLATYVLAQFVIRARNDGLRPTLSAFIGDTRGQFYAARGRKLDAKPLSPQDNATKVEREDSEGESLIFVGSGNQASTSAFGEKVPGVPVNAPV